MAATQIEHIPPDRLRPWAWNARTHSRKQVRQIAGSIRCFGFTNPVLIDEGLTILAGHGRVEAAKLIGMETVPCLRLDRMSEAEKRAYVLADNKLALNAGWDEDLLAHELKALLEIDAGFDVTVTGFEIPEIDALIEGAAPEEPGDPADEVLPEAPPRRCRVGDVWQLGRHRLACGDALDPAVVDDLMVGEKARMVFCDPPYNVPIDGNVGGLGRIRHREFAMASGEMTKPEFTAFLRAAMANLARSASTGRSTSSAWTGATWARCSRPARASTPS